METKHAQGPWEISRGSQNDAFSVESPTQTICNVKFIKGQSLSEKGIKQEEANARLIAAAPDLLEACKEALSELKDWNEGYEKSAAELSIEAAIRKAEGE